MMAMMMWEQWMPVGIIIASLFIIRIKKLKPRTLKGKLPKGNWSLPLIGETLQFLRNPHHFFLTRVARHGGIFQASLFGEKCIVITTAEATKWVLQTAQNEFKPAYPQSAQSFIDPSSAFEKLSLRTQVKKVEISSLSPECIRYHLDYISAMALKTVEAWPLKESINAYEELKKYTLYVIMKILCGMDPSSSDMKIILDNINAFEKGFMCVPINLPFTTYHAGLKARDILFKLVERIIQDRETKIGLHNDMLQALIHHTDQKLTKEELRGVIMSVIFAGYETTAAQLVWTIKHLHDNPNILEDMKEEHKGIGCLTSSTIKDMQLTSKVLLLYHFICHNRGIFHLQWMLWCQVLLETFRISYVNQFIPRQALQDVEFKEFLIPKDWKVYASVSTFHLNPSLYEDPYKFDPYRFQEGPTASKYMPFGNGNRMCPGSELAKVLMTTFLYHLARSYSWTVLDADQQIKWFPVPVPKHGLNIQVKQL